jgi:hypothetical protein
MPGDARLFYLCGFFPNLGAIGFDGKPGVL